MAMSFSERIAARRAAMEAGGPATSTPALTDTPAIPTTQEPANAPTDPTPPTGGFKSRLAQRLASSSSSSPAAPTSSSPAPVKAEEAPKQAEERVEVSSLPKVIQAYNVSTSVKPATLGESLSGLEPTEAVKLIQQRIHDMQDLEDAQLKYEMEQLSEMLVANPSACLYLLDEDLGLAVRALRRMTNNRVAVDMSRAKPRKEAKASSINRPLTAEEAKAALDEL